MRPNSPPRTHDPETSERSASTRPDAESENAVDGQRQAARDLGGSKTSPAPKRFKGLPPPTKNMSRSELAEQYDPYVRAIAGKVRKTLSKDIEFDDLHSYGMIGLMEAADRFDSKYGANFMTFAYYRIRGAIYDGLRGMGWVSRSEYQKYRFEQHATEYLRHVGEQEAVGGAIRKTEDDEVSEIADAVEGLITIYVTALDAMEGFQIPDETTPPVDETLEIEQARRLVVEAIDKLPEQERVLLKLYYYEEHSLEDVGKHLGLSKSWTSRLHARAIDKLGRLLKELVEEHGEGRSLLTPRKSKRGRKMTQPVAHGTDNRKGLGSADRNPPTETPTQSPSGRR